jgi:hypothetical protein
MGILENAQIAAQNAAKAKMVDDATMNHKIGQAVEQERGLAASRQSGMDQTKMDLSNMILNGSQEDAIRATQFATEAGIFNPVEMKGLAATRMERDMSYGQGR